MRTKLQYCGKNYMLMLQKTLLQLCGSSTIFLHLLGQGYASKGYKLKKYKKLEKKKIVVLWLRTLSNSDICKWIRTC